MASLSYTFIKALEPPEKCGTSERRKQRKEVKAAREGRKFQLAEVFKIVKVCYDWWMVRKHWNKAKVIFMAWTSPVVSRVIPRSGWTIEYLFGVFEGAMGKTSCL